MAAAIALRARLVWRGSVAWRGNGGSASVIKLLRLHNALVRACRQRHR